LDQSFRLAQRWLLHDFIPSLQRHKATHMGNLALLSVAKFCEMEPSKSKNAVFSNYTRFARFFGWKGGRNFTEFS
jgi:hypothetical protein